jgi:hypothetical protein
MGGCDADCRTASLLEDLNRSCHCISLDRDLPGTLIDIHPHLFASLPVFVPRSQIEQMARVVNAVEQVVQTRVFRAVALGWAPEIAQFDPGVRGEISDHSHSIVAGTFKCLTSAAFY